MSCGCSQRRAALVKAAVQVKEAVTTQIAKVFSPRPAGNTPKSREEMIAERVRKAKMERMARTGR